MERNGTGVCDTQISYLIFWNGHVTFLPETCSERVNFSNHALGLSSISSRMERQWKCLQTACCFHLKIIIDKGQTATITTFYYLNPQFSAYSLKNLNVYRVDTPSAKPEATAVTRTWVSDLSSWGCI